MADSNPPPQEGSEPAKLSKSAAKKLEKKQKKADSKAANTKTQDAPKTEEKSDMYGILPLIQSSTRERKVYTKVQDLDESKSSSSVLIRARIHTSRPSGNLCFLFLRQGLYTIQGVVAKSQDVPKAMVNFVSGVTKESIVDVYGDVVVTKEKILKATQQTVEIQIKKLYVVSAADNNLPIQLEDASRPEPILDAQRQVIAEIDKEIKEVTERMAGKETTDEGKKLAEDLANLQKKRTDAQKYVILSREARLDNRVLDLRTSANQAVFRIQSAVCQLFREYLLSQDFTEIHSPKIIGGSSEGGAEFFEVKYFERSAFLAQSPQLYKQMAITADLDRVFEIGPVFRAENSFTHRHMTEFVGLDLEMAFNEHYHEVLDVLDKLFVFIFEGLTKRYAKELEIIPQQYPFQPFKYNVPSLRLDYKDAVALLREAGEVLNDLDDLDTRKERRLGELIKKKHGVDFYILDRFPYAIRPFYTMPAPDDKNYANAYDFFMRGEEIMSGAQRVHDPELLTKQAIERGVTPASIQPYIDSFKFGAPPHAGGGVGLERVVMLYLGLSDIRQTSMFPRDPHRVTP